MNHDYDQAAFLIGACYENSGINATEALEKGHFRPHPALEALLDWFGSRGETRRDTNRCGQGTHDPGRMEI